MAINIFEGSRRIAKLIAGMATVGTLFYIFTNAPYVHITYSIALPGGPFSIMEDACPSDAGTDYLGNRNIKAGKDVYVELCLLAMSFGEHSERLIPYEVDEKGLIWGNTEYSDKVSAYKKELEKRFTIPADDEKQIEKKISQRYWESTKESLGFLVGGLLIFGATVWTIGWIVRGFLGIPRGMDRRPN